jgi:hypothetical protein
VSRGHSRIQVSSLVKGMFLSHCQLAIDAVVSSNPLLLYFLICNLFDTIYTLEGSRGKQRADGTSSKDGSIVADVQDDVKLLTLPFLRSVHLDVAY